ncbi:MAG TPA: glutathione S-transferase [Polyangiaceae bacterium]|nr:glutathione S-transferase [Polyangiaceae bacterium]
MKPVLFVGNRNYSSWSLRPWLVLTWGGIDFETKIVPLGGQGYLKRQVPEVLAISPAGTVPALHLGSEMIPDSLAISEWAAEQIPALWPKDSLARAQARAVVCEMHSGFSAVRSQLPCNIRRRAEPRELSQDVALEVERIQAIWTTLRQRFGGSGGYLFGSQPTIADAFFTPLASRFRTYKVGLTPECQSYADRLLTNPAFLDWQRAALDELWSMPQWDSV